ncbi:MAG TPA: phosphodiester glycosidase family protein [Gaiellaceae bacterium]|nr:phosphodiester glycosidase family protein [Gaiellaceae bacterium]
MLRKLPIAGALFALLASSALAATALRGGARDVSQTTSELLPGVTYTRQVEFTPRGPVVLDVVTAPRPDGSTYTLAPVLSNEMILGTETLTALEKRLSGSATVVGVSGDYFATATGAPSGILLRDGALDKAPLATRSSLGIAADGTLAAARVAYKGTWQGSGQRRPVDLNAAPAKGHATLYTPAYGPTTPDEGGVVEVVLPSFPAAAPNRPLTGTVGQVVQTGLTPIPAGGAVLVARGQQAQALTADAPVGQQVEIRLTLTPNSWSGMVSALGGGPLLVQDGKPVFDAKESFAAAIVNRRNARSAVGRLADGRILLVTVEGGRASYSVGMTSYELAVAMKRLGAVTAIGLGSGTQAGMAFDGTLLTRPSGAAEAPVSDALVLSYTGVYAAPPAVAVLSPNGDGVDDTQTFAYKLVRPSHVVATLTGPGSASIQLADDDEQPGVHTLAWDGKGAGEGAWRFSVTAADDAGKTTTARRDFSLDDTLAGLAVARGSSGGAAATFQLTRSASVVVTVERRNGISLGTLFSGTLGPGAHTETWDGKSGGRAVPNGGYQVRVEATSSIGKVSLVAPFAVPLPR